LRGSTPLAAPAPPPEAQVSSWNMAPPPVRGSTSPAAPAPPPDAPPPLYVAVEPPFASEPNAPTVLPVESGVPGSTITFACPGCTTTFQVKNEFAGRKTTCPKCGTVFYIPSTTASSVPAVEPPRPVLATAPAPPQFYFIQNGQRLGPLTLNQMQELVASNRLHPEDQVWREGMAQWAAAEK